MRVGRQSLPRLPWAFWSSQRRGWTPSSASRVPSRRGLTTDTDEHGARTLANVVRELRKQGRLPADAGMRSEGGSQRPVWASEGFVDIDSELAYGVEGAPEDEDDMEEEDADDEVHRGRTGNDEDDLDDEDASDDDEGGRHAGRRGDAELRLAGSRPEEFEDVSHLSEEELRARVRRSIEELVPPDTAERLAGGRDVVDTTGMTPAQVFYLENREKLVSRAQDYYLEKQRELKAMQDQDGVMEVEDEWRYYHEPVVRPPKGHLWSTGEEGEGESHGSEQGWLDTVLRWPRGEMPTAEMLADLLRAEQARDIVIVDLGLCDRRDLGTFGVLMTGVTPQHCRRLGEIAAKATEAVKVPHVEAFCYGTRKDEWVVAHCGSIKVHVFTRDTREEYKLQQLWETPEHFFVPGDFPHYLEIYGTASQAVGRPDGHITSPTGSRSTGYLPPPFRDAVHASLAQPDYDAAEDAQYITDRAIDVRGTVVGSTTAAGARDAAQRWGGGSGSGGGGAAVEEDLFGGSSHPGSWQGRRPLGNESDTDDEDVGSGPGVASARRGSRAPPGAESDTDDDMGPPTVRTVGGGARPAGRAVAAAVPSQTDGADGSGADAAGPAGGRGDLLGMAARARARARARRKNLSEDCESGWVGAL
eukprot:CAMPEP_0204164052 /NCGR_PEP_ID=MMETSP0361-20130328/36918_1 /ASSEMBLY_ACC=CAM_ASM_000343 /TAXON_ID=268821 /ORGANISM="Scrippsiella Hangoei, Strain SHTV-5" /LENGTH=642 /DNA_ID=CAMNT_0051120841 /DNA_START=23 /DNA_END=1949 /DNA_ORIENTATION=-